MTLIKELIDIPERIHKICHAKGSWGMGQENPG